MLLKGGETKKPPDGHRSRRTFRKDSAHQKAKTVNGKGLLTELQHEVENHRDTAKRKEDP